MKKLSVFVFLSLFLVSSFVSAQPVDQFLSEFTNAVSPIARYILGSQDGGNTEQFFAKVLVFLLVTIFAAAAAKRMPLLEDKPASSFFVAVIISVLGVRFITTPELIELIWLPTSTFAVALTAIIPFVVFFFVIEGFDSRVLRKFAWSVYLVIFTYFAYTRYNNPALLPGASTSTAAVWIYLAIAVLSGCLIFFDNTIRAMFRRQGLQNIKDRSKRLQAIQVASDIDELYTKLSKAKNQGDREAVEKEINVKEANLRELYK